MLFVSRACRSIILLSCSSLARLPVVFFFSTLGLFLQTLIERSFSLNVRVSMTTSRLTFLPALVCCVRVVVKIVLQEGLPIPFTFTVLSVRYPYRRTRSWRRRWPTLGYHLRWASGTLGRLLHALWAYWTPKRSLAARWKDPYTMLSLKRLQTSRKHNGKSLDHTCVVRCVMIRPTRVGEKQEALRGLQSCHVWLGAAAFLPVKLWEGKAFLVLWRRRITKAFQCKGHGTGEKEWNGFTLA